MICSPKSSDLFRFHPIGRLFRPTDKATTHKEPIYTTDGIIHYCVANMPGAVAKTSTLALTNATLPYAVEIAKYNFLIN